MATSTEKSKSRMAQQLRWHHASNLQFQWCSPVLQTFTFVFCLRWKTAKPQSIGWCVTYAEVPRALDSGCLVWAWRVPNDTCWICPLQELSWTPKSKACPRPCLPSASRRSVNFQMPLPNFAVGRPALYHSRDESCSRHSRTTPGKASPGAREPLCAFPSLGCPHWTEQLAASSRTGFFCGRPSCFDAASDFGTFARKENAPEARCRRSAPDWVLSLPRRFVSDLESRRTFESKGEGKAKTIERRPFLVAGKGDN